MKHFFDSELYAWIGLVGNIITYSGFIFAILLIRHYNKLRYYPYDISGGDDESWPKSQKAIKYSKTRWARFLNKISKVF